MVGLPLLFELNVSKVSLVLYILVLFQDFYVLVSHVLVVIVRLAQFFECVCDNAACFPEPWRVLDLRDVVVVLDDCVEPVLNLLEIGMVRVALGNAVTLGLQQRVHNCVLKGVINVVQVLEILDCLFLLFDLVNKL